MDQRRKPPSPHRPTEDEHTHLSKPQIFVQLAFGVSWSERHAPRSHKVTYMSRNLKNARDCGNFPRHVPPPNTNFLAAAPETRQHRHREHSSRHHHHSSHQRQQSHPQHQGQQPRGSPRAREPGSRGRPNDQPRENSRPHAPRELRVPAGGVSHERGRSAPPPINDSPWDAHAASSATLFPHPARASRDQPQVWKALPTPPCQYRLGEDGLPWSAWAWPTDPDGDEHDEEPPFANNPTTVPLSPDRRRFENPDKVRDLESLSTAMMTVDNGFENQWWYQGSREPTQWSPAEDEDVEDDSDDFDDETRSMSMAEAMLLSAAEPPGAGMDSPDDDLTPEATFETLVSPISDSSTPVQSFRSPHLFRSMTTRSEELWLER